MAKIVFTGELILAAKDKKFHVRTNQDLRNKQATLLHVFKLQWSPKEAD